MMVQKQSVGKRNEDIKFNYFVKHQKAKQTADFYVNFLWWSICFFSNLRTVLFGCGLEREIE